MSQEERRTSGTFWPKEVDQPSRKVSLRRSFLPNVVLVSPHSKVLPANLTMDRGLTNLDDGLGMKQEEERNFDVILLDKNSTMTSRQIRRWRLLRLFVPA